VSPGLSAVEATVADGAGRATAGGTSELAPPMQPAGPLYLDEGWDGMVTSRPRVLLVSAPAGDRVLVECTATARAPLG
jgi:hypothetical protein